MVECTSNKGLVIVKAKGGVAEITADAMTFIHALYKSMYEENKVKADVFRETFIEMLDTVLTIPKGGE